MKKDKNNKKKKHITRCFYSADIDLFIEFYKLCGERNLGTDDAIGREELLLELMEKRKFKGCMIVDYNKTRDQIVDHFSKTHGKVLNLSDKNKLEQFKQELEASKMNQTQCPTCQQFTIDVESGYVCINPQCPMNGSTIAYDPTEYQTNWTNDDILDESEENQ